MAGQSQVIGDWLAAHASAQPARVACIDLGTGRRFTYRELYERVARLAGALRASFGVGPGDRVMTLARNSTDLYEILFAAWRLGAAFMPVNWRLAANELSAIIDDGEPRVIVCDEEFLPLVAQRHEPKLMRRPGAPDSEYERAIHDSQPVPEFFAATPDTMNTLLYTSGTTGAPKGVIGTWRMTATMVRQAGPSAGLTRESVTLTAAPQFHTAGLNSFAIPLFYAGGTLAVMARWDAGEALTHLADAALGVTHTLGVPTQYWQMTQQPSFGTHTFPRLRVAAVGGAPPSAALLRTCAENGMPLTPGYGMTEVFGVTIASSELALEKPGALGRAALDTELRVVDARDRDCPANVVGEILIRSPGVTPGYWRQPAATRAAFLDDWLRTGDLGYLDDTSCLFLVDRKKDMYISGGENVFPAEIENVLAGIPDVAACAVIGVPDEKWGEVGAAFVVSAPGYALDREQLLARCRAQLAAYKVPKTVTVMNALPMSAQGKVLKTELRRLPRTTT